MGTGIAQLCLQRGFPVVIYDAFPGALISGEAKLKKNIEEARSRGRISEDALKAAIQNLKVAMGLEDLANADILIEAVSEDLKIKGALFGGVSESSPRAILATNTSSLPVEAIARYAKNPERVLGLHFFNPPVATKLVEIVRTPRTDAKVLELAWDFVQNGLGKTPIAVLDTPGFVVNRVMRPYYLESQSALLKGARISELDRAAREIGGVPMGPFELMDWIGLDVNLAITQTIYAALGRPERLKPRKIQEKLVELGQWGRKSGKGFYLYQDNRATGENPEAKAFSPRVDFSAAQAWEDLIGAVIEEAKLALKEGVAGKDDIDWAIKLAMNFPRGPFSWQNKSAV